MSSPPLFHPHTRLLYDRPDLSPLSHYLATAVAAAVMAGMVRFLRIFLCLCVIVLVSVSVLTRHHFLSTRV